MNATRIRQLASGLGMCLLGLACAAAPTIRPATSDESLDIAALAAELMDVDVVFLGELHDSASTHRLQFELVDALRRLAERPVVTMEMFERDVQPVLDDYLAGRVDEQRFLAESRPWKTYRRFYRRIVELARREGLPVVAANMPTELSRAVARGGEDGLRAELDAGKGRPEWVARSTSAPEDEYWRRFREAMAEHMGAGADDAMRRFYQAQCYKDDTMAESIVAAVDANPGSIVVHLNGRFHSDHRLGTAARVIARRPELRVKVVTALRGDEPPEAGVADYLWLVPD